jgi:hypothetical protein
VLGCGAILSVPASESRHLNLFSAANGRAFFCLPFA